MNEDIYSVLRSDYKSFVERLKPNVYKVEVIEKEDFISTKIFSVKTKKCLCGRKSYKDDRKEEYFIFEYPEDDEWGPPVPKCRIVLETAEEVQMVLDGLAKLRREKENVTN